jgi:hypothetical protein
MRTIKTDFIFPPIPPRQYDWVAYFDGDEESGPRGYGETEKEAVDDLVNNYTDDEDEVAVALGGTD